MAEEAGAGFALHHLVRPPAATRAGAPPLLLLLHGVGSNEQDLMGLAPYLDDRFLVASARAPLTLGPGAYAWFEVSFTPEGPVHDQPQAEDSRRTLLEFIPQLVDAYSADPSRVFVMGFSQGAIMTVSLVLTAPRALTAAVAMSGRVLPEMVARRAPDEDLKGLPVLVTHGLADGVLPIRHGRGIRDVLERLPLQLTYREYPAGHEVSAEMLGDIASWLTARLGRA